MFDVEQCKKDGWRCEVVDSAGEWVLAEFLGFDRDGLAVAGGGGGCLSWRGNYQDAYIRNVKKPKITRMTHVFSVSASFFKEGYFGDYHVAVPLIANAEGHPVVDHSDAILEVLEAMLEGVPTKSCIRSAIQKIKRDRGE